MTMDRVELLRCMREAAEALAEFRHLLPVYCPEAMEHYEQALLHFDVALALCERCASGDHRDDEDDDGGRDDDDDDDAGGAGPNLRIKW